jgi:ABC-type dipeptide/oligopeptide/nickel transport system permease component
VLTYVVRRLLFSIPVLFATTVLIFFSVTAIGDPLAELKVNPLFSKVTIHRIEQRKHLNDPVRAKGVHERRVLMRHALRNALIPVVTVSGLNFGGLIGGAVVTETIFQLDGMGPYFINNLLSGDVYVVMAWLVVTAASVIVFNLLADIAYAYIDPRIRLS